MNQKLKKVYYIIPVIYFAVVGMLFFLQFRRSEEFTAAVGGFEISGTYAETGGGRDGKVKDITVVMGSLGFRFSPENPLSVTYTDGEEGTLQIERYRQTGPEGCELQFSGGLLLELTSPSEGGPKLVIRPQAGAVPAQDIGRIFLSFSLPRETELRAAKGFPIIALTENGANSVIFLEGGSAAGSDGLQSDGSETGEVQTGESRFGTVQPGSIHTDPPVITFAAGPEGNFGRLVFKDLGSREADPIRYWFTGERKPIGEDAFQGMVETYRDTCYTGWKELRLDRGTGAWVGGNGSVEFTEDIFLAAASEALFRDDLAFFTYLVDTAEEKTERLTYRSICFTGGLRGGYESMRAEDEGRLKEIQRLLETGDPALFSTEHFVRFILTRAPYALIQNVYALSESVSFDEPTLSQCIDLLSVYNEAVSLLSPLPAPLERLRQVADARILPAVIKTDDGLSLPAPVSGGTGQAADLALTLRAGIELRKVREGRYADLYRTVGREMVASVIRAGDESGIVPRIGRINEKGVHPVPEEGVFGPESFHPDLFTVAYAPRFVPLHRENGPGTWMFTAAQVVSTSFSDEQILLTLQFPENLIHHFILQGIGDFGEMILHDLSWPSDPNFEIYSSGWVYDDAANSLLVKLEHRQQEENIILNF